MSKAISIAKELKAAGMKWYSQIVFQSSIWHLRIMVLTFESVILIFIIKNSKFIYRFWHFKGLEVLVRTNDPKYLDLKVLNFMVMLLLMVINDSVFGCQLQISVSSTIFVHVIAIIIFASKCYNIWNL